MSDEMTGGGLLDEEAIAYSRRVGQRLRAIRRQKKLSLQEVEATSTQEFKASVLGAYERGERAISVPRLQRLARFYGVPVDQLLPDEDVDGNDGGGGVLPTAGAVTIDLRRLGTLEGAEVAMISRYVRTIMVQRQDFNGIMLTIRRDDLRAVACALGVRLDRVIARLEELDLLYKVPADGG